MFFFLTTRLDGVLLAPVGEPFCSCLTRFPARGEAYGGGLRDRAASQSKGVDADNDGLVTGDIGYTSWALGVDGAPFLTGVEGDGWLEELAVRGEFVTALFV